jgi:hypothetical protein
MRDSRPKPSPTDSFLKLAVAAGIDDGEHIEIGVCNLVEVAINDAGAVARA